MKYIVCVIFEVKPKHYDEFLPLMKANAKTSLQSEEGCMQFDVCINSDEPYHIFLYEAYTSKLAFNEHLKSAHFLLFNSKTADMIAKISVKTYSAINEMVG